VLCIELDGRITAWLNKKDTMENANLIKFPEGRDRANIRLADVEHTGRADLLYFDKYTGDTTMLKNDGYWLRDLDANGGSSFHWTKHNIVFEGVDRGGNIHFANLGGLGRADMVQLTPASNDATAYFSECDHEPGNGGDDAPVADPELPPYFKKADSGKPPADPGLPPYPTFGSSGREISPGVILAVTIVVLFLSIWTLRKLYRMRWSGRLRMHKV
jgi:hypothetical protein